MSEHWLEEQKEDIAGQSENKKRLIKEVLENATTIQLLAVRYYLERYLHLSSGNDCTNWVCEKAIEAFDNKKFDDSHISFLLDEGEFVQIMQQPETVNEICTKFQLKN